VNDPQACVIGWPIKHSRSPVIHKYWLKELGLSGDYGIRAVAPEEIERFVQGFAGSGLVGANVTVPHKETVFALVTDRDAAATATGAMNTLWLENGVLAGANTDPVGFLANLDEQARGWDQRPDTAIVLGAGGAARGIVWALTTRGFGRIVVANRTLSRAEQLARELGNTVDAVSWQQLAGELANARVLINATTLGMSGQGPLVIDLDGLPGEAVINDIVYTPLETPLLAAGRARGLTCVDGLGMLPHQAVPGFARWFGATPRVSAGLRAAVIDSLGLN
jgi:shikimate dehydrogenase